MPAGAARGDAVGAGPTGLAVIVMILRTIAILVAATTALDGVAKHGYASASSPPSSAARVTWERLPELPAPPGVAGPFCGVIGKRLIVAGGANFPDRPPWDGGAKVWHDTIWGLDPGATTWRRLGGGLPRPLAYGVAGTWRGRLLCVGGSDAERHHAECFAIDCDGDRVVIAPLPPLPAAIANATGLIHEGVLYVVGGSRSPAAVAAEAEVWALDVAATDDATAAGWTALPALPMPGRMLACCGVLSGKLVIVGGTALRAGADGTPERIPLADAHALDLAATDGGWRTLAPPPRPIVAAPFPAPALGATCLLFLGGDDGWRPPQGPAHHPGFRRELFFYDLTVDTWTLGGATPSGVVTTAVVPWNGRFVIPSGEVRPGVRTTAVWSLVPAVDGGWRRPVVAALIGGAAAVSAMAAGFRRLILARRRIRP